MSMEADVAFFEVADRAKADLVTRAIGEDSNFHQLRGYYAEGIHDEISAHVGSSPVGLCPERGWIQDSCGGGACRSRGRVMVNSAPDAVVR